MERGRGGRVGNKPTPASPQAGRAPRGSAGQGRRRRGELGPYLVSSGRVGAGVSPQGRELLLQAVVGAVAEAVDDPRRRQDPGDAGEGQEGEQEEFRGLCLFPALRQRRDVAFLQGRRERQRLSCAVTEQRGGGIPSGGKHPAALTFGRGGRQTEGQGQKRRRAPLRALPSPPEARTLPKAEGARRHRGAPRGPEPRSHRTEGRQGLPGAQQATIQYCIFLSEK